MNMNTNENMTTETCEPLPPLPKLIVHPLAAGPALAPEPPTPGRLVRLARWLVLPLGLCALLELTKIALLTGEVIALLNFVYTTNN